MQPLANSRRAILQATYAPIETPVDQREMLRGPEKRALLLMLRPTSAELEAVTGEGRSLHHAKDVRTLIESGGADVSGEIAIATRLPAQVVLDLARQRVRSDTSSQADLEPGQQRVARAFAAFADLLKIEPIGYLHLEKLAFTPIGVERGELVYSVPLAPAEEINLVHREWSNTSEEFERLATDLLEEFSEEGVTEKSELQQSTENQYQHSTELSASVNVSGRYGTVQFAASGSADAATSSERSEEFSRNQSNTLTRKASRRSVKEHKITFRVASASGVADEAVKKFKNPHRNKPIRVDYYRMMRKWSVDLLRYGIRLTYDLVVPEPGADLLDKILEVQAIEAALREGFGSASGPLWAQFNLKPTDLTRENYADKAADFVATVEAPPPNNKSVSRTESQQFGTSDQSKRGLSSALEIDVDLMYSVTSASASSAGFEWPGNRSDWMRDTVVVNDAYVQAYTLGRSGKVAVPYSMRYAASFSITVTLDLTLRNDAFLAWRNKAWVAIRDTAERRYYEQRAVLQQRLAELQKELGAADTLTLRRMEREEMMKGALRWLLGPSFTTNAKTTSDYYDTTTDGVKDDATWLVGRQLGERLRFLQQAVEWENLLYIVYPYFWATKEAREVRKFLDHPDPLHRAFLRAGAARVVLTIRPGFEASFLEFLGGETGTPAPYLRIAQEMEAFANTNYPGIRPANEVEDARSLLSRRQRQAWNDIQLLQVLLEDYLVDNDRYPASPDPGMSALMPFAKARGVAMPTTDPWDNAYVYSCPGEFAEYDLASYGENGEPGGTGDAADITSWAEASLVGQWFEYTPTSALDIGIDVDEHLSSSRAVPSQ
ncbi:hypothetical protein Franean1_2610 [Parafrankia sp. EAN1pec]|uniref:type II secretion system protein GspG n=1 Tax=Parafrankia sp. (strain EAN1pec) TaxID=298653 RepID=UPI0000544890|nr:hypothetical protein Franean1_2610 [Frankia sp. EAN1pec]